MKTWARLGVAALALAVLAACSKVTPANFDKINNGMKKQQVVEILGEPSESSGASFLGLSGGSAVWRDGKTSITVQFINGEVVGKTLDSGEKGTSAY
ncbi:outer membrane protein assembly factor BamE domain-containing protein [Crenobacter cavernae]|uniref:Outer membrane protein assembly factor BamE n=1 Tax=Crenobacter cavernae TaxID=2290923 RepID=A0A345Y888_9NEIS|nr:outer membrane protein assembly factor BamE [Crenobacter cavernae]AXK40140.1 outer membrane protein assembly factor BamE [Crenobacter cavernae]RXZ42028.1 outer membrane protein assembly factor BamE [Crenobacter cavernae]